MMKNAFYFTLKVLKGKFQNLWRQNLAKEQLQYTYCPISQEVTAIAQWNFFSQWIITYETFFLKYHIQNVAEKLSPDPFLKTQNWTYLWIIILKFNTVCFYCMPSWGLSKFIRSKLQTTCFYLIKKLFLKTKRGLQLVSLPGFLTWLLKKNISLVVFY